MPTQAAGILDKLRSACIQAGSPNVSTSQGGMAHLGLDASSPSRCSSCSGPPRSASPGMGGARCALRTGGSCNSGSVQWLPCRTGPQACRETECRGGNEARKNQNTPRRKLKSPTHLPGKILLLWRPRQWGSRALASSRIQLSFRSPTGSISCTKSTRELRDPINGEIRTPRINHQ